jgi:hypothetical protein
MTDNENNDLTGDPVFEYLKTWVLPGHKVIGGRIEERTKVGPKQARKVISILIQVGNKKRDVVQHTYNYAKLLREIASGKRAPNAK